SGHYRAEGAAAADSLWRGLRGGAGGYVVVRNAAAPRATHSARRREDGPELYVLRFVQSGSRAGPAAVADSGCAGPRSRVVPSERVCKGVGEPHATTMGVGRLIVCEWLGASKRERIVESPSWPDIEAAIRALDGKTLNDIY